MTTNTRFSKKTLADYLHKKHTEKLTRWRQITGGWEYNPNNGYAQARGEQQHRLYGEISALESVFEDLYLT